jgi:hypothetical protein
MRKALRLQVIGVNISPEQNTMNLRKPKMGVGELIDVEQFQRGTAAGLPIPLRMFFPAKCSATLPMMQLFRAPALLKSGAALVFTDIMGSDGADEKISKTSRIATQRLMKWRGLVDTFHAQGSRLQRSVICDFSTWCTFSDMTRSFQR